MNKRISKRTNRQSRAEMPIEWDLFHDKETINIWENSVLNHKPTNCNLTYTSNTLVSHTLEDYMWATITILFMTFIIVIQN